MIAARVLAALLVLTASLGTWADVAFKKSQVKVGTYALKVEVAAEEEQRMQGMMYRKSMGQEEGMLFIDKDGVILNILDMEPQTLDSHMAAGPAVYAIETNKGWFAAKKIKPGDKVNGLPKPTRAAEPAR